MLCLWGYLDIYLTCTTFDMNMEMSGNGSTVLFVLTHIFDESQIRNCSLAVGGGGRVNEDCFVARQLKAQMDKDAPLFKLIVLTCAFNLLVQSSVPILKG